jgi:hypothetical protein
MHFDVPGSSAGIRSLLASVPLPSLRELRVVYECTPEMMRMVQTRFTKMESMSLGGWDAHLDEVISFAASMAKLKRLELYDEVDLAHLIVLGKLPHLESLVLQAPSSTSQSPDAALTSDALFSSLTSLTLHVGEASHAHLASFLTPLVKLTPQVRVLLVSWVGPRDLIDLFCFIVAGWPSSVVPQLQHLALRGEYTLAYDTVLPYLTTLLQHRPMRRFCVHLLDENVCNQDAEITRAFEASAAPCVRLCRMVVMPYEVTTRLLRVMDEATKTIKMSKEKNIRRGASESCGQEATTIRTLATVELQHVLSFLSQLDLALVSRVSPSWYRAVDSPLVWSAHSSRHSRSSSLLVPVVSCELLSGETFTNERARTVGVKNPWRSALCLRRQPAECIIDLRKPLTPEQMQLIKDGLGRFGNIVRLILLYDQHMELLALPCLRGVRSLRVVQEWSQEHFLAAVFSTCRRLERLEYFSQRPLTQKVFATAPDTLRHVFLSYAHHLAAESWFTLASLPHLVSLDLDAPCLLVDEPATPQVPGGLEEGAFGRVEILRVHNSTDGDFLLEALPILFAAASERGVLPRLRLLEMVSEGVEFLPALFDLLASLPPHALLRLRHVVLSGENLSSLPAVCSLLVARLPRLLRSRRNQWMIHVLTQLVALAIVEEEEYPLPVRCVRRARKEKNFTEHDLEALDRLADAITQTNQEMVVLADQMLAEAQ